MFGILILEVLCGRRPLEESKSPFSGRFNNIVWMRSVACTRRMKNSSSSFCLCFYLMVWNTGKKELRLGVWWGQSWADGLNIWESVWWWLSCPGYVHKKNISFWCHWSLMILSHYLFVSSSHFTLTHVQDHSKSSHTSRGIYPSTWTIFLTIFNHFV